MKFVRPTKDMLVDQLCRYKIIFQKSVAGEHDELIIQAVSLQNVQVIVTGNARINDCNFSEKVLEEGDTMTINFPKHAYIVALATGDKAKFVLGYQYIDRDPAYVEPEEQFNLDAFMKTKHFMVVLVVASVVVIVILSLIGTLCVY